MYSSSYNPPKIHPKHTFSLKVPEAELAQTPKVVKALREGKSYKCGLCMTVFAQKDYYLNHLRNEHWNQKDIQAFDAKKKDQQFDSKFSKPITENLTKRPRVNIISAQDIMKNEKELHQRITLTSNVTRPGDKVAPKAFEMKLETGNKKKDTANSHKIAIPPPRKRVRKGKRKPLILKKRDLPTSEEETRASFSTQKARLHQNFGSNLKKLKVRSANNVSSLINSPNLVQNVSYLLSLLLMFP